MESPELLRPTSLEEAVSELSRLGPDGAPLAGATWVMRAPLRGERFKPHYVALQGIEGLGGIQRGHPTVIGALSTHAELDELDDATGPTGALAEAARRAAFPSVRNVATLGGNICARPFPEADLVPALIASGAELELVSHAGHETFELSAYLAARAERPTGEILARVRIPAPPGRRSWFERLTVRNGGEYALASVAVSIDLDRDGTVSGARVAIGSVGEVARRSEAAEETLLGRPIEEAAGEEAGRAAATELEARDGLDAPGWYRLAVLPALLRRALARIASADGGRG